MACDNDIFIYFNIYIYIYSLITWLNCAHVNSPLWLSATCYPLGMLKSWNMHVRTQHCCNLFIYMFGFIYSISYLLCMYVCMYIYECIYVCTYLAQVVNVGSSLLYDSLSRDNSEDTSWLDEYVLCLIVKYLFIHINVHCYCLPYFSLEGEVESTQTGRITRQQVSIHPFIHSSAHPSTHPSWLTDWLWCYYSSYLWLLLLF